VADVSDDPEVAEVFAGCVASRCLATRADARRRVTLVTSSMEDIDENAALVNALQRHATVVVQESLVEGFELTVAEGMWKAKAVVTSCVGGITEQVTPGTSILLKDPTDLSAFGHMLAELLPLPREIAQLGSRARQHVLEGFVGDKHLILFAQLVEWLASEGEGCHPGAGGWTHEKGATSDSVGRNAALTVGIQHTPAKAGRRQSRSSAQGVRGKAGSGLRANAWPSSPCASVSTTGHDRWSARSRPEPTAGQGLSMGLLHSPQGSGPSRHQVAASRL
jgi:hypothetical protein